MSHEHNETSAAPQARLLIDVDNKEERLPRRFRMTSASVPAGPDFSVDLKGLTELYASGSGQFSQLGLQCIKRAVGELPIIVVDLRQESHGFVNGMAVSWYGLHNGANKGLSPEQAAAAERRLLDQLSASPSIAFDQLEGKSVDIGEEVKDPKTVQTAEQLVRAEGLGYKRFFVTDHHRPLDPVVDEFIEWAKTLPERTWLHFHCRGGVGRTSTFMNMYDMMYNAGEVSFDHIMKRHVMIGGKDFDKLDPAETYKYAAAVERIEFIKTFYSYCLDGRKDGFAKTWSEWLKKQTG